MNKKSLTMGMILPLAAAGAVATASPASAAVRDHRPRAHDSSVSCELTAEKVGRNRIKLTLEVNSRGNQGDHFSIRITDNGDEVVARRKSDPDGDFTITERVRNRRGDDHFRATVENRKTGDRDTCSDTVRDRRDRERP